MSASALHLNLLNAQERVPASPVRLKVLLPVIAGIVAVFIFGWLGFIGFQVFLAKSAVDGIREETARHMRDKASSEVQLAKLKLLQSEYGQYISYGNGRVPRGELFKRLAFAIPEGVTLTSLEIPPQPDQGLILPPALGLMPLQGPTQTFERVELRIKGLARMEKDVFDLMNALKGNAFTGLVSIIEHPAPGQRESPRVEAFRQEAITAGNERRGVLFDIVYDLQPREFVK